MAVMSHSDNLQTCIGLASVHVLILSILGANKKQNIYVFF